MMLLSASRRRQTSSDSDGSDHDYGNWLKKTRSYASLLFSASRWLMKKKAVIRRDQHIGSSKQMVFECIWLSRGKVRWCFFATGFQNPGTPGVTSFQRCRQQVSALWPPICGATVRRIDQRPSTNTHFFTWSVIWLGGLTPWGTKRRGS